MKTRVSVQSAAAIASLLLATAGVAYGADSAANPWVGTWTMDQSQSKLTGGTFRFTGAPDGEMAFIGNGHSSKFKTDGQPYKTWSGEDATWKKVDENTYESNYKLGSVDLENVTWTVSADGKMLKTESKGTNPDGSTFSNTGEAARVGSGKGLVGTWKTTKEEAGSPQSYSIKDAGPNAVDWDIPALKATLHATLDGKDITPDGPTVPKALTVALLKVSPTVLKETDKMSGEVVSRNTMTLSPDGKTITNVVTPSKDKVTYTEIWRKQ